MLNQVQHDDFYNDTTDILKVCLFLYADSPLRQAQGTRKTAKCGNLFIGSK